MADETRARPGLVVGLTGGIASGKSAVAAMFVALGAGLVDADAVAREVVAPGEPGLKAVREAFGPRILLPSGELDRAVLRSLVFADEAKRRRLESLLHPLIRARTLERLRDIGTPYAIVAVPLLVETDFGRLVDRVLVVDCPEHLQLERLMKRDALPRADALAMIRAQADRATRLKAAHDVIDNSGTREATRAQVEQLNHRYLELAAHATRHT
jgi:dephospho-CoA kinase